MTEQDGVGGYFMISDQVIEEIVKGMFSTFVTSHR